MNDAPGCDLGDTTVAVEQTGLLVDATSQCRMPNSIRSMAAPASTPVRASRSPARAAPSRRTCSASIPGARFTVSGNDLKFGGATFATIVNADGTLTIGFTSAGRRRPPRW